ncbi:Paired box domain-containing protein [Ditylenchus destructor]|uniref:Paired box domain-containing protein n=1 Tax=Ditylenchus destructor TaxID=166010 RepID=A0AAD4MM47_9BILA|nr:Paired box domain-containing protein [Ditylenchus destructor]
MDSDDEVRIVIAPPAPKRPRAPNAGIKVGTKNLTAPQKLAIVRANEQGRKKSDIAKIFETSITTVNRVLDQYRSEGTVKHRNCGNTNAKKTTPEIEQFIVNASENDVWHSAQEAVIAVKKKFGVQICRQTVTSVRYKNGLFGHRY